MMPRVTNVDPSILVLDAWRKGEMRAASKLRPLQDAIYCPCMAHRLAIGQQQLLANLKGGSDKMKAQMSGHCQTRERRLVA